MEEEEGEEEERRRAKYDKKIVGKPNEKLLLYSVPVMTQVSQIITWEYLYHHFY